MLSWQQWMNKSQASITAARNSLEAGDLAAAVSRAYCGSIPGSYWRID
jgi:hypothetical protein